MQAESYRLVLMIVLIFVVTLLLYKLTMVVDNKRKEDGEQLEVEEWVQDEEDDMVEEWVQDEGDDMVEQWMEDWIAKRRYLRSIAMQQRSMKAMDLEEA